LDPGRASYREQLGIAYLRFGKLKEAKDQFEAALRINPNYTTSYQQLAAIQTRLGDPEGATKYATQSTGMFNNDNQLKQLLGLSKVEPRRISLRLILADRYRALGSLEAARDEYLYVLQLDPHNQPARAALAAMARPTAAQHPPG
jgi:Tfp pilus assembly protein PilF